MQAAELRATLTEALPVQQYTNADAARVALLRWLEDSNTPSPTIDEDGRHVSIKFKVGRKMVAAKPALMF